MKKTLLLPVFVSLVFTLAAQNVAINNDASTPHASAMLDVKNSNKGMLIPRVSLLSTADVVTIVSPATSLLVFNTNASISGGSGIGFYTWSGSNWIKLISATDFSNAWNTGGNSGTSPSTNFVGTVDNLRLVFRVNNTFAGSLDPVRYNSFYGFQSGLNNSTGTNNVAVGAGALYTNQTRDNLVAIGDSALFNNGLGATLSFHSTENTAIGSKTLYSNTTGYANTANGNFALYSNTEGNSNVGIGHHTLFNNTIKSNLVAIGDSALYNNGLGATQSFHSTGNTAIGSKALYSNTSGYANTANGFEALYSNTTGYANTANGYQALYSNTTGSRNTANGRFALYNNTEGNSNVAIGIRALYNNTTKSKLVAIGDSALYNNGLGATVSSQSTGNTAIGSKALYSNTTGLANTANGFEALYSNTTGVNNTANGSQALYNNTSGYDNTANGINALYSNTTGFFNTANGRQALYSNTTGHSNTANGINALHSNTTGIYNTANGSEALNNNTTGSRNTANGINALYNNTTGDHNSAIGNSADVSSGALTNANAFGYNATVSASNKVRIGNTSVTVIEGQVAYSFPSDARFKNNIQQNVPGLDFITKLKPVTYTFDTRKFDRHLMQNMPDSIQKKRMTATDYTASSAIVHTGFLAQDIEKLCKETGYDFDGLHIPDPANKTDNYSIAYSQFIMPMVKAMQEQQKQIEDQQQLIQKLITRIEVLEKK
jgi:hypothetical protein